ncbi:hypothetical protein RhiirA5_367901, partial [Rhizophagus irregularis]
LKIHASLASVHARNMCLKKNVLADVHLHVRTNKCYILRQISLKKNLYESIFPN